MHLDVKLVFMLAQYQYKDALQYLIHQLSVYITVKPLVSLKLPILHLQLLLLCLILLQHFLDAFDPCSGIFCVLNVVILVFGEALDVEEAGFVGVWGAWSVPMRGVCLCCRVSHFSNY